MLAPGLHRFGAAQNPRPRWAMRLAALGAVLATLLLGLPAPSALAADAPPLQVVLTTPNSGEITPGQAMRTFVTIENPSATDTAPATATIAVVPTPLGSRSALDAGFDGTTSGSSASRVLARTPVPPVATQLSAEVTASVPAASLGFRAAGVYGISVTIASGSTILGSARAAVAWGTASDSSVPVAVALPITVPAAETEFLTADELTKYTAPNGVLTRELSDVQGTSVAIGIDPRIIASIRVLGNTAPPSAIAWLNELAALPNESFPLAWADADLTAPLRAGSSDLLEPRSLAFAINPSLFGNGNSNGNGPTPSPTPTSGADDSTVPTPAGLVEWHYTLPKLQWPAINSVQPADLAKFDDAGIEDILLASRNVDDSDSHGLGGALGTSGSTTIGISDDELSTYLADAVQATTRVGTTNAISQLTTTFALIGELSPGTPRPVLLTLDRNWVTADTSFARALSNLYAHPGVSLATLSSVFAGSPRKVTIDKASEPQDRIDSVSDLLAAEARLDRFSVIAANPIAITSSYRLQLLSLLSNEWTDTPAAWTKAANAWVTHTLGVVESVRVSRSGRALALADQVELPISITNGLDQPVTVTLEVRSTTTQVSVDPQYETQTITIDADSQKRVQIPIEALSNGKGTVLISLHSADGLAIGRTERLTVDVQAGWESIGTLIFVALIVALFAFGLTRRLLKSRRERAAAHEPAESEPSKSTAGDE